MLHTVCCHHNVLTIHSYKHALPAFRPTQKVTSFTFSSHCYRRPPSWELTRPHTRHTLNHGHDLMSQWQTKNSNENTTDVYYTGVDYNQGTCYSQSLLRWRASPSNTHSLSYASCMTDRPDRTLRTFSPPPPPPVFFPRTSGTFSLLTLNTLCHNYTKSPLSY